VIPRQPARLLTCLAWPLWDMFPNRERKIAVGLASRPRTRSKRGHYTSSLTPMFLSKSTLRRSGRLKETPLTGDLNSITRTGEHPFIAAIRAYAQICRLQPPEQMHSYIGRGWMVTTKPMG
jgi:hypothetical protein